MADVFDTIGKWLLNQAIEDADLSETLDELGKRLVAAGVPVCRIVIGRGMAHPVIGLATLEWTPDHRNVDITFTPPSQLIREEVLATPFGHLSLTEEKVISARLTNPEEVKRFLIFEKLYEQGVTHYLGFGRSFTPPGTPLPASPIDLKGAVIAFCTKRLAGFSSSELDGLERLISPLCVCIRVAIDRILVSELLDRYLGPISGSRVLKGQTSRGDGTEIECALFYSDMRNSAEFSRTKNMDDYLGSGCIDFRRAA
ncbi:hypothetical protein [Falsiphaeobacter marinintestinus]|uniref:hypothetical protein n=1 Tax=Falsiphaeobacter marinintestinus TaxID=1492905 RepID=UPI0011B5C8D9|nr:hypothetical protein [Phaeobacter marinintestinus]